MSFLKASMDILEKISEAIKDLEFSDIEKILEVLIESRAEGKKVLVVGAGRSGLVGKAFAMRLMHLGFDVHVMGETITPAIGEGDIILIISGSGSTTLPVTIANIAQSLGAQILAITSNPESPLGKIVDHRVIIPGRMMTAHDEEYYSRQLKGEYEPLAPMGTLFEDTCMIFFDALIIELMRKLNISEDEMKLRHASIE